METIKNYLIHDLKLQEHDVIVIGCSGGPDSMALMYVLQEIKKKIPLFLVCAHVNHNVRSESKQEEQFLQQYCEKNKITFESMTIEKYGDDNFHNEARKIRYHFFEEIVTKYQAQYLMTAHHGDDLTETILMRIVRGSTLKGYAGFEKEIKKDGYRLIRPLISVTKDQIEQFNKQNNIPYVVDNSNFKGQYTRNRYRMEVLPFLKQEDPLVHEKFIKFSDTLIEYNQYINKMLSNIITSVYCDNELDIPLFLQQESLIQKKILFYILEELYPDDLNHINMTHVNAMFSLINSKKANSILNFPDDIKIIKEYRKIKVTKKVDDIQKYEIELTKEVFLPDRHKIVFVTETENNDNYVCRLLSDEVTLPLYVRTRQLGDRMGLKKTNGTKKVKDIFIDCKVPLTLRDTWPIVVDSKNQVLWIPGIKKSKFSKQKNEKYDIILKYN